MKKKLLSWVIAIVVLVLIAGARTVISESIANGKIDKLAGRWVTQFEAEMETKTLLLTNCDFYQEELELAKDVKLYWPAIIELNENRVYRIYIDDEIFRSYICEMLDEVLDALYDGREKLVDVYGEVVMTMTRDEFRQAYAELYGLSSDREFIDIFADSAYDYEEISEPLERGTFTVEGKKLLFTITGETEAEYATYQLNGDTLTLTYSDGVEVYTRVD